MIRNIGIVILVFIVFTYIKIKNKNIINKIDIDKRNLFNKKFHNKMLDLSYCFPFRYFVPKDFERDEKIDNTKKFLKDAQIEDKYNVRSFMAFKFFIFLVSFVLYLILVLIKKYSYKIRNFLFKTNLSPKSFSFVDTLPLLIICLFLALLPNIILKVKAKKNIMNRNKDIPLLQMFIILMLKSGKTVNETLYLLSKLSTPHKNTFIVGYRIYTRNPEEGFSYMKERFDNKKFQETFDVLEEIENYSRKESIMILENNMGSIVNEFNDIKRRNDLTNLLYSQASMIVPFLSIILFVMLPIIIFVMRLFINIGNIG